MKTPDEIKKGLNCNNIDHCNECPYDGLDCAKHVDQDALSYIQQLEVDNESKQKRIDELESRLAQVERERDVAVQTVHGLCLHCKNDRSEKCRKCLFWPSRVYFVSTETYVDHWEWRGVCPESTKEEK